MKKILLFLMLTLAFGLQTIQAKEVHSVDYDVSWEELQNITFDPPTATQNSKFGRLPVDLLISTDAGNHYDSTAFSTPVIEEDSVFNLKMTLKTDLIKTQLEDSAKENLGVQNSPQFYSMININHEKSEFYVYLITPFTMGDTLDVELQNEDGSVYNGVYQLHDEFDRYKVKNISTGGMLFNLAPTKQENDYVTLLRFKFSLNRDFQNFAELYESIMAEPNIQLVIRDVKAKLSYSNETLKKYQDLIKQNNSLAEDNVFIVSNYAFLKGSFSAEATVLTETRNFNYVWDSQQEFDDTLNLPASLENDTKADFYWSKKQYQYDRDTDDLSNVMVLRDTFLSLKYKIKKDNQTISPVQPSEPIIKPVEIEQPKATLPPTGVVNEEVLLGIFALLLGSGYLYFNKKH